MTMATNYSVTSWIPYGTNDSLSAIVFSPANDTDYDVESDRYDVNVTSVDVDSGPFENATLDVVHWAGTQYNWNGTVGFNASLNELPLANGSVAFFNPYDESVAVDGNGTAGFDRDDGNDTWSATVIAAVANGSSVFDDDGGSDDWLSTINYYAVDLYNDSRTNVLDVNVTDGYTDPWEGSMYPSGHSVTHIAITATIVTLMMIMVVVGNMLVIVAIMTEKNLKTIQNWFIASLAVADFFLGLVIMPFSLAQELMGYWIFGSWWCEIYLAVDVLLCTSSIMNLCLISLDRYWSITQAVDYLKKRTASRGIVMITTVWILSFLISVPPLIGWKKIGRPKEIPYCEVSDDFGYVVYSASGSFFIPSVIMVFVYVRIYFAARSRARRVVKKHRPALDPTKDKSTTTTSFSNASPPDKNKNAPPHTPNTPRELPIGGGVEIRNQLQVPPTPMSVVGTTPIHGLKHDGVILHSPSADDVNGTSKETHSRNCSPANNNSEASEPLLGDAKSCLQVQLTTATPLSSPLQRANTTGGGGGHHGRSMFGLGHRSNGTSRSVHLKASPSRLVSQAHALAQAQAQILLADDMECLSELDHSSDSDQQPNRDGQSVRGFRRLTVLCNPPSRRGAASAGATRSNTPQVPDEIDLTRVPPKPRDPEREKRRIARKKERRATLILGLIMAAFILCWLPFFTMYIVRALCSTCVIDDIGFALAFWLGYCNSALNPVIYTIFNKDFRKAFRKILFK